MWNFYSNKTAITVPYSYVKCYGMSTIFLFQTIQIIHHFTTSKWCYCSNLGGISFPPSSFYFLHTK